MLLSALRDYRSWHLNSSIVEKQHTGSNKVTFEYEVKDQLPATFTAVRPTYNGHGCDTLSLDIGCGTRSVSGRGSLLVQFFSVLGKIKLGLICGGKERYG